ncbi:unnamed protein product [Trypanosoma congolense IL3000]|uniref:WGS project CAEQ00000000 data, annotated contig 1405 n=1 Tax=Trypanosoma congolense (strain IL3000) TaxID=1068625 RepID=F9W5Z2_TRYCI|nr:unnamed protein product [Trypanosoma congolense IL3000]
MGLEEKGMWFWMVMVVGVGTGTAAGKMRKSHNHHELADLCEVLGAEVILYNFGVTGAGLRKALGKVIFWKHAGGNLEDLQKGFPEKYGKECARTNSLGKFLYNNPDHYPRNVHPTRPSLHVYSSRRWIPVPTSRRQDSPTLCGRSAAEWEGGPNQKDGRGCHNGNEHWRSECSYHRKRARKHLDTTWDKVVKTGPRKRPTPLQNRHKRLGWKT